MTLILESFLYARDKRHYKKNMTKILEKCYNRLYKEYF